jgi:hypothetical protein
LTAKIRLMAQNLVHGSRIPAADPALSADPSFHNFEKLQRPIQAMAGAVGSQTLLLRALVLAKAEFPRLAGASIDRKGTLQGLAKIDPPLTQEEADEAEILLIGNTVALLCIFLGEAMALRLIQDQWPGASFAADEPAKEGTA